MIGKTGKLVIIGTGEFGQIAYEYFTYDSCYEVAAFAVEKKYKDLDKLYEKPVIEFEKLYDVYSPILRNIIPGNRLFVCSMTAVKAAHLICLQCCCF